MISFGFSLKVSNTTPPFCSVVCISNTKTIVSDDCMPQRLHQVVAVSLQQVGGICTLNCDSFIPPTRCDLHFQNERNTNEDDDDVVCAIKATSKRCSLMSGAVKGGEASGRQTRTDASQSKDLAPTSESNLKVALTLD